MKVKTKNDLNTIIDDMVVDYNTAQDAEEKGKVVTNLLKVVNVVKEIEKEAVENRIKKKKLKLDEEKLELDKLRIDIDVDKLDVERDKLENDRDKTKLNTDNDIRKIELDDSKLEFDKQKFDSELDKAKSDKVFSAIMKGLEVGIPLIIYGGLSVLSLKAIYKDDVRVPSETWNFIKSVSKK